MHFQKINAVRHTVFSVYFKFKWEEKENILEVRYKSRQSISTRKTRGVQMRRKTFLFLTEESFPTSPRIHCPITGDTWPWQRLLPVWSRCCSFPSPIIQLCLPSEQCWYPGTEAPALSGASDAPRNPRKSHLSPDSLTVAITCGSQSWQRVWSTSRSTPSLLQTPPTSLCKAHFLHSWWESRARAHPYEGKALWEGRINDISSSLICSQFKFSHVEGISESSHMIYGHGSHRVGDESLLSALPQAQGTISFIQHINSINHSVVWLKSGRIMFL